MTHFSKLTSSIWWSYTFLNDAKINSKSLLTSESYGNTKFPQVLLLKCAFLSLYHALMPSRFLLLSSLDQSCNDHILVNCCYEQSFLGYSCSSVPTIEAELLVHIPVYSLMLHFDSFFRQLVATKPSASPLCYSARQGNSQRKSKTVNMKKLSSNCRVEAHGLWKQGWATPQERPRWTGMELGGKTQQGLKVAKDVKETSRASNKRATEKARPLLKGVGT